MSLPFTKLHGIGNDFVFIDNVDVQEELQDVSLLARAMCDRHTGIGADGLIIMSRASRAPFRMTMYNPDGSNGGMCGNGVRCAARFLIEQGHQRQTPFYLEVEERIVRVEPIKHDWIRVNMGPAFLTRGEIGITGVADEQFIEQPITVAGQTFSGTGVSMGNPHLVIFTEDVDAIDLQKLGPLIEHHEFFPQRTNVHFAESDRRDRIKMRTWERGAGITLACGSGACSVGVAGFLTGRTEREVTIALPGGELRIEYTPGGEVFMEGAAERVFDGDWVSRRVTLAGV